MKKLCEDHCECWLLVTALTHYMYKHVLSANTSLEITCMDETINDCELLLLINMNKSFSGEHPTYGV